MKRKKTKNCFAGADDVYFTSKKIVRVDVATDFYGRTVVSKRYFPKNGKKLNELTSMFGDGEYYRLQREFLQKKK